MPRRAASAAVGRGGTVFSISRNFQNGSGGAQPGSLGQHATGTHGGTSGSGLGRGSHARCDEYSIGPSVTMGRRNEPGARLSRSDSSYNSARAARRAGVLWDYGQVVA